MVTGIGEKEMNKKVLLVTKNIVHLADGAKNSRRKQLKNIVVD